MYHMNNIIFMILVATGRQTSSNSLSFIILCVILAVALTGCIAMEISLWLVRSKLQKLQRYY